MQVAGTGDMALGVALRPRLRIREDGAAGAHHPLGVIQVRGEDFGLHQGIEHAHSIGLPYSLTGQITHRAFVPNPSLHSHAMVGLSIAGRSPWLPAPSCSPTTAAPKGAARCWRARTSPASAD